MTDWIDRNGASSSCYTKICASAKQ